ncbi:MAG: hypothetical protein ACRD2B_12755 [Terriglobia bacterium]
MSAYIKAIMEDTGCNPDDAAMIEDIMRNEIFHSTLDWQTRAQFCQGARQGARILDENRELFEDNRARTIGMFDEMKRSQK